MSYTPTAGTPVAAAGGGQPGTRYEVTTHPTGKVETFPTDTAAYAYMRAHPGSGIRIVHVD